MKLVHDAALSSAPIWDAGSASLLWVERETVHRLHPGSETHSETVVPQPIGAIAPRTNGGLVANLRDGIGLRDLDDRLTWLVYWQRDGASAGPAAVAQDGSLWAVTGDQLIHVEPDGRPKVTRTGTTITGLAATDRVYLATAHGVEILGTGELFIVPEGVAGLCVDAEDHLWIAVPEANQIRRHAPDGTLDRTLDVPGPTGCCFGGTDFADLYITAGSVFVVSGAGVGLPGTRFLG
ncbi:MAG TPA: SMP-30/gluconolactonase/LRE family protein [Pseudonocardiaceae bacterium]|nr:SMP-30/gluconolactonase/LRE family protein [Pseudonocardiaceae bacterium]